MFHPKTINFAQDTIKKYTGADLKITKPTLHTEFSPNIEFKVDKIYLSKDNTKILDLEKFNTKLSFQEIFAKKIIIKKLVLNTQIIENNIQDSLVYLSDIQGNIDFKLNIKKI